MSGVAAFGRRTRLLVVGTFLIGAPVTGVGLAGAAPSPSTRVPALQAPGAPSGLHGRAGDRAVSLSWTAPTDDGGQPVARYQVEDSTDGGTTWKDRAAALGTSAKVNRLHNGTTYQFRVRADNDFAVGDPSNIFTATPMRPPEETAFNWPQDSSTVWGTKITLKDTLFASSSPLPHVNVTLLGRGNSRRPFKRIGHGTTNRDGEVKVAITPRVNTTYEWSFAGNRSYKATTSRSATVSVAPVVIAHLSKHHVKVGQTVLIYGTVSPKARGQKVQLVVGVKVGGVTRSAERRGHATIKKQRLPDGHIEVGYILRFTPTSAGDGEQNLGVYRPKTATNVAGESRTFHLKIG